MNASKDELNVWTAVYLKRSVVGWNPAEDHNDAFKLVEKMMDNGGCEIGCYASRNGDRWFEVNMITKREVKMTAHTAPEAITKCFLLAIGKDDTE